jgi:hypothetical protein
MNKLGEEQEPELEKPEEQPSDFKVKEQIQFKKTLTANYSFP